MAKRFYWLKLQENFFNDDTVQFIEEQDNGTEYLLFYLKLCLQSVRTEGLLIRLVGETLVPHNAKSLAKLTGTNFDTVRGAIELFNSVGIIKFNDDGSLYLPQVAEMVGSETDKARLMRLNRASGNNVTIPGNNVTRLLPYIEKEIEKEKEQEKDRELKPGTEERGKKIDEIVDNFLNGRKNG